MAKNLVPNGDFELGVTGWADLGSGITVNTLATTNTWKRSGQKSLEYKATNSTGSAKNGGVTQPIGTLAPMPVVAGQQYTFNVWLNYISSGGSTGIDLVAIWDTAAGTQVSTSQSASVTTKSGEQFLTLTATAPATAELASIRVRINNIENGKTAQFQIDNVEFFNASEVSIFEKLVVNGFNLNDQVRTTLEALTFTPAQPKAKFAENPNADGVLLVEEPQFTPAYFEAQVRVIPKTTLDEALEVVGELLDALQGCTKVEGGAETEWTPNNTTATYTAYALLAELADVPINLDGELAGWFVRSPVLKIKITCRPFLHTPERVVLNTTASTSPTQTVYVGGIKGDVPAEGRMLITNKVAQRMRFFEWGQDVVESETNPTLVYEGTAGLQITGFIGESSTKAGSKSTNVVKAKLNTIPMVICSTGPIEHIGDFEAKIRINSSSNESVMLRASYRSGDGTWTTLGWVEVWSNNEWIELDLKGIYLEEAERGTQVSEIRVEGKGAQPTVYVDLLTLIPTKRRAVARAKAEYGIPAAVLVADTMSQTSGSATGKTADVGGVYAAVTNSDTDDFTIASGKLKRTAVSDTGTIGTWPFKGRGIGLPVEATNLVIRTSFLINAGAFAIFPAGLRFGHIVSYVSNTNFLVANLEADAAGSGSFRPVIQKPDGTSVAGGQRITDFLPYGTIEATMMTVVIGNQISMYLAFQGENFEKVASGESSLAGAKGKAFIYDQQSGGSAVTREYDNLVAWTPAVPAVCEPSKTLEISSNGAARQDATGTFWSPVPEYRGGDLWLEPAGKSGVVNRISNKIRRNDTQQEADENITDERSVEILARERYLAPR